MEVSTCQPDSTTEAIDGSRERDGEDVDQERAQRYEGASILFGPHTLSGYIQEFKKLSKSLVLDRPVQAGPQPPDLLDKQVSFLTPVVVDTTPAGDSFGDVISDVPKNLSLKRENDLVTVVFQSAYPRNDPLTEGTLTANVRLLVYDDDDLCMRFKWSRPKKLSSRSEATVEWRVPESASPRVYRITHFGAAKSLFGSDQHFTGSSSAFVARRRRGRTPTPGKYLGLRAARGRHRSPSYSPRRSISYSRSRSRSYSSDRSRSYTPSHRRSRRSLSNSPYYRRGRSYSYSRSPSPDDRYYRRRDRSESPYYRRRYRYKYRSRSRSYSPDYRARDRSYSPYYRRRYRSRSRSYSPDYRTRDRSYSPYYRGRDRSYSPYYRGSYSPESRYHKRSVSRSVSPVRRSRSRSLSPKKGRKVSRRSKSHRRDSRSSMNHSRSARSSTSRSVSP
ncbi:hypothetical protein F2Q69_00026029 [Brassica cretica]|uniref:Neutral ceramidase n=1 Tax=Brassica cretica TaxID=69181 RepID=A0A8S9RYE6_BRACR|nr:hypothetical protein F2Q69_00026029 [Brassica cretica]